MIKKKLLINIYINIFFFHYFIWIYLNIVFFIFLQLQNKQNKLFSF